MDMRELTKIAGKNGVPLAIVEKDFALSIVLCTIAESELKNSSVFKGGTAIKKVYFSKARFSEDLDFTVIEGKIDDLEKAVRALFTDFKKDGINITGVEHEKSLAGLRMALKFTGPLNHPQRIRLDFSFREAPAVQVKEEIIIDEYNLGKHTLKSLCLEEILAEKFRAISSRTAPRDLYDIWFLFNNGVKINHQLVEKKFEIYNEKFDVQLVEKRMDALKEHWRTDLQQFIKTVPTFETVENEVMKRMQKEFAK